MGASGLRAYQLKRNSHCTDDAVYPSARLRYLWEAMIGSCHSVRVFVVQRDDVPAHLLEQGSFAKP
jgi:hypothetical protein